MSQAKVDRYKEEKRNRAKIIKREKREWAATKAGLSLVALVLVAWIGFSVYSGVNGTSDTTVTEKETYTVDTSAIDDFLAGLSED
jgi:hypothetical protein